MAGLIARFDTLLSQADDVVVHFSGHGYSAGGLNWLAPTDLEVDSRTEASFGAMPLDSFLQMLGEHPGEAALFLGLADDVAADTSFADSLTRIDIPQGVMVVRGEPTEVADAVRGEFLVPGRATTIARNRADEVVVEGYVSRKFALVPAPESREPEPVEEPDTSGASLVEQALWALAEQSPNEANLGAYINRFPNGVYIAEARRLMAEIEENKVDPAVSGEETLSLTRNQRREIQEQLTILGYDTRGVDGIFGRGSRAAIEAWQRTENLEASGYLNADQVALLKARAEVRADELEAEAEERKRQEELADIQFWQATGAKGTAPDYRAYLSRYPEGIYAQEAKRELDLLEADEREQAEAVERTFWDGIAARNDAEAYREYLQKYPNGTFANTAKAKLAELTQNSNEGNREADYLKTERGLGLNVASVALIEQRLKMLRFDPGAVDGRITGKTRSAIKSFQRREGMQATGYLNSATLQRLIIASSR